MDDCEPMGRDPEWFHKRTGRCENDGRSFIPSGDAPACGVVPFRPKNERH
jgi:hypothetical protein